MHARYETRPNDVNGRHKLQFIRREEATNIKTPRSGYFKIFPSLVFVSCIFIFYVLLVKLNSFLCIFLYMEHLRNNKFCL